jgi:hypothetical protein
MIGVRVYARHGLHALHVAARVLLSAWRDWREYSLEYEAARQHMASLQYWSSPPARPSDDTGFSDGVV